MFSLRRTLLVSGTVATLVAGGMFSGLANAQESQEIPAGIYAGSCFDLSGDPVFSLTSFFRTPNPEARALPVAADSVIEGSIDQLVGETHSIVATRSGKLSGTLACGEINAIQQPDGTFMVGLREVNGSQYAGVAVLTPIDGGTQIRAYIAGGLPGGVDTEEPEDEDVGPIDDSVSVTITDTEITADQTVFQVGSRVEFIVTNEGTGYHEVMLELAGADEEPLETDGVQAETEDLPEGEFVAFYYRFDEPGTYQLAEHIGNSDLVLEITVE